MHYKYRKVIDTRTQPYPQVIHALSPRAAGQARSHALGSIHRLRLHAIEKYVLTRALEPVERSSLGSRFRNQELREDKNI